MSASRKTACLIAIGVSLLFGTRMNAADPPAGPYQDSWQSLASHQVPDWLLDAKFGIYAHWGVYSVPAFGNEWYAKRMYDKRDKLGVYDFHREKYGDPSEFGYKDLIPRFKAEKFNPDAWAELVARSGAKYAGIAVVHHDGFLLWDSDINRWNAGNMGPKRDLYGELVESFRKKGLKTIATFHHIRTFNWYLPGTSGFGEGSDNQRLSEAKAAGWDLFDPKYADLYWNETTGTYEDFIEEWKAKVKEVADKYQPDVMWFDGGSFQTEESQHHVLEILSYYLNRGAQWGKPVEVLNKLPTNMKFNFPEQFGVLTFEEGRDRMAPVERPWIDDQKISTYGWGYLHGQEYKSANEILDGLIDRVSRGGGLLLSLCPMADGTINEPQTRVLLEMGDWLARNGEAIYGTRTWKIRAEGYEDKLIKKGKHPSWKFDNCDATDIRFTRKGNTLYAIALGWPEGNKLVIKTLSTGTKLADGPIRRVTLLGSSDEIKWLRTSDGLTVTLPSQRPNDIAYALRIDVDGELDMD